MSKKIKLWRNLKHRLHVRKYPKWQRSGKDKVIVKKVMVRAIYSHGHGKHMGKDNLVR